MNPGISAPSLAVLMLAALVTAIPNPASAARPQTAPAANAAALHFAAARGDVEAVRRFLDNGVDVEADFDGRSGQTPLHSAAQAGREQVIGLLLARGARVDALADYYGTPLHMAARGEGPGNAAVVRLLVGKGAKVDALDDAGRTPLQVAAAEGGADVAAALLGAGADPDARNSKAGTGTPIGDAARRGREDIVRSLLARKANPDGPSRYGGAALDGAADVEIARLLLATGAALHPDALLSSAAGRASLPLVEWALSKGADPKNPSALEAAVHGGDPRIVTLLIDKGADPTGGARPGAALRESLHLKDTSILELLLDRGAAPDARERPGSRTALHEAAAAGNLAGVGLLLARGADVNAGATPHTYDLRPPVETPLHLAVAGGRFDVVRLLLEKGADVNAGLGTPVGTPLHYAHVWKEARVAELLARPGGKE